MRLAAHMRETHGVCDEHGDVATASLLEVWIDEAERRVWFLFETARAGEAAGGCAVARDQASPPGPDFKLQRPIDRARDHVRGGTAAEGIVSVVMYGDYLCHYCRSLRTVLSRFRQGLGERLSRVFTHF